MDFPQLQSVCDPQSDLKSLGENLNQRSVSLPFSKYEKVACWVKQKQSVENPEFLNNDDLGQILIPDDIIFREGSKFIACRATRDGHCLFNSASRILVGNESEVFPAFVDHSSFTLTAISMLSNLSFKSILLLV